MWKMKKNYFKLFLYITCLLLNIRSKQNASIKAQRNTKIFTSLGSSINRAYCWLKAMSSSSTAINTFNKSKEDFVKKILLKYGRELIALKTATKSSKDSTIGGLNGRGWKSLDIYLGSGWMCWCRTCWIDGDANESQIVSCGSILDSVWQCYLYLSVLWAPILSTTSYVV